MSPRVNKPKTGLGTAYISTVIGIVMVLFVTGVIAWFLLGLNNLKNSKMESFEFDLFFNESVNDIELGLIESELQTKSYVSSATYRSSEEAWDLIKDDLGGDSALAVIDGENPLNQSVAITLKKDFFSLDSIQHIEKELMSEYDGRLIELSYREEIFEEFSTGLQKLIYFVLLVTVMLLFVAIGMINNTIRLALYSKRFLIRTMQLVGATPGFIRKPFLMNAIGQGLISGLIAGTMVLGFIILLERYDKHFGEMTDMTLFLTVLAGIVLYGILITMISTLLALRKYMRLDLDKLY